MTAIHFIVEKWTGSRLNGNSMAQVIPSSSLMHCLLSVPLANITGAKISSWRNNLKWTPYCWALTSLSLKSFQIYYSDFLLDEYLSDILYFLIISPFYFSCFCHNNWNLHLTALRIQHLSEIKTRLNLNSHLCWCWKFLFSLWQPLYPLDYKRFACDK